MIVKEKWQRERREINKRRYLAPREKRLPVSQEQLTMTLRQERDRIFSDIFLIYCPLEEIFSSCLQWYIPLDIVRRGRPLVEAAGVEPASRKVQRKTSTCLASSFVYLA